jgi:hypothetical protein
MKTVLSTVRSFIANFKQTEFDKQCGKMNNTADRDGVEIRYQW